MINKKFWNLAGNIWRHLFCKHPFTLAERYPQYEIGRGTYGDLTVLSWDEGAMLSVGNYSSIATGVKIFLSYSSK